MSTEVLTGSFRVPQPQGPQGGLGTVNLLDIVNTAASPSISPGAMVNGVSLYLGSVYLDQETAGIVSETFSDLALVGCASVFASTGTAVDELLQVTGYVL